MPHQAKHFYERKQFQIKLTRVAKHNLHEFLARELGIAVSTLRNWLYRDLPPMREVERLNDILTLKWKKDNHA